MCQKQTLFKLLLVLIKRSSMFSHFILYLEDLSNERVHSAIKLINTVIKESQSRLYIYTNINCLKIRYSDMESNLP